MGGHDGGTLATVEAYNPRTNTWRSCLPLSQHRTGAVAGVVGGRLVVAGGYGGRGVGRLTSAEAYTPTGWIPLPPLPHETDMATACVLNGRLYVTGGVGCNKLQVLEMSEENGFSWSVKAELPSELDTDFHDGYEDTPASAVMDGQLWLLGPKSRYDDEEGWDDIVLPPATFAFTYDIENDTWATGPALPRAIADCNAYVLNGKIHVIGPIVDDYEEDGKGETIEFRYGGDGWEETTVLSKKKKKKKKKSRVGEFAMLRTLQLG